MVDVQGGRQHVVVDGLDHFDQPRYPGSGLSVTEVGFDRSQPQGVIRIAVCAIGRDQCAGFDRIAQRGAGAVGLYRVHLVELDSGVGDGLSDDTLLGWAAGGGEPVGGAVLVDR
ncbi:hypothetical protein MSIMFB_03244 [Mycobacterium simulans]|uniref:Uncharacterized protein n=1 Tax=Mycobacterium simulans TaxID=627089 RepID=A0A7Z7INN0_9MYCO|nr:hypothetical protein MSIMFB_03244 [Mycobacterium simulans]